MHTTSASLLRRLRDPGEHQAWGRFVELYTPLLWHWAGRLGLQEADVADLVQDLFAQLLRKLPEFDYDPERSFRGWLHRVLMNLWRDRAARLAPLGSDAGLSGLQTLDSTQALDEAEYRDFLIRRALELLEDELPPATRAAFTAFVLEDRPAQEVAQQLGTTVNAVYLAKSRVIRRLRQELNGLLD